MAEVVFVLARGQNAFFVELAAALSDELEALGVETGTSWDGFGEPRGGRAYVLLPPHEYVGLVDGRVPVELLGRTVFVCAEQPGSPFFELNVHLAGLAGAVFDINAAAVRRFRELGIAAEHLRLGYTPRWDRFDPAAERDVEIAFLGCMTERRERILAGYAEALWRYRAQLVFSDNSRANASTSASFLAGEDKLALLARTKLLLNVHRDPLPYFEWYRALEAIHCGAVIVSEHAEDHAPLIPGEHFVAGHAEELHLLAAELLSDPEAIARRREAAYSLIREQLPLRTSAERLAEAATRVATKPLRRARGTERKLRAGTAGRERPLRGTLRSLIAGLRRPGTYARAAVKRARLAALERRRRKEHRRVTQERGAPPPEVEVVHESAARRSAPAPQVSVVTALYNHAEHIEAALDSVERGRFRDFELIVVDDGSNDDSGEVAQRWMERHDSVPALLLRHPVNRGLPASRNTGIEHARGEHVLVLDSDNELYPNCLERLVEALDGDPEAAFAYGMLQVHDGNEPSGLLGYFGWEPERLAEINYIDALALIHRSALGEAGGFCTDLRLYGWEDYDLWCTLASRGMHAVHVKEIVARYRRSPVSMVSLTNLSWRDLWTALAERHPEIFQESKRPDAPSARVAA